MELPIEDEFSTGTSMVVVWAVSVVRIPVATVVRAVITVVRPAPVVVTAVWVRYGNSGHNQEAKN